MSGPKPERKGPLRHIRSCGDSGHTGHMLGTAVLDPNAKYGHIRWRVAMKDNRDVCLACARWAMLSRSNSLHNLSADLAAAVCVGVNIDVPAASLQVGGLGVR